MACKFCGKPWSISGTFYATIDDEMICHDCFIKNKFSQCFATKKIITEPGFKCDWRIKCEECRFYYKKLKKKSTVGENRATLIIISTFLLILFFVFLLAFLYGIITDSLNYEVADNTIVFMLGLFLLFLPLFARAAINIKSGILKYKIIERFFHFTSKYLIVIMVIASVLILSSLVGIDDEPRKKRWSDLSEVEKENARYSHELYEALHDDDAPWNK